MNARDELRKGWCPSAYRPMETGDGLLLRVRPRAGTFSIAGLEAITDVALRFGSGEIDLTNRGNLQLRGLCAATYGDAAAELDGSDLIDKSAEAESVRNVVVDPLSGIDPARRDVRTQAAEIEARFARNPALWNLPAKFGVSFSGLDSPCVGGRKADVMAFADKDGWAICIDGDTRSIAFYRNESVVEPIERLMLEFLKLRSADAQLRKMRDAVARFGSAAIFAAAGLVRSDYAGKAADSAPPVGTIVRDDKVIAAGVGLPFGRISGSDLATLCKEARALGISEARPSNNRVIIFEADYRRAAALLGKAASLGLITSSDDIRLAMDVCPGAPSCRNGTTFTRADAQRVSEALHGCGTAIPTVHISGCEKGCARREPAALTFIARKGAYDLVLNDDVDGAVALARLSPARIGEIARSVVAGTSS